MKDFEANKTPQISLDSVRERGPKWAHSYILRLQEKARINEEQKKSEKAQEAMLRKEKLQTSNTNLQKDSDDKKKGTAKDDKEITKTKQHLLSARNKLREEKGKNNQLLTAKDQQIKGLEKDKKECLKLINKLLDNQGTSVNNSPTFNNNPVFQTPPESVSKTGQEINSKLKTAAGQKVLEGLKMVIDGFSQFCIERMI